MTTYVYETIPQKPDEKPRYFEIKQSMNAEPLTKHPETGEAIRRVVLGGMGALSSNPIKVTFGGGWCHGGGGWGCCR